MVASDVTRQLIDPALEAGDAHDGRFRSGLLRVTQACPKAKEARRGGDRQPRMASGSPLSAFCEPGRVYPYPEKAGAYQIDDRGVKA
jgi:hypothetical protein